MLLVMLPSCGLRFLASVSNGFSSYLTRAVAFLVGRNNSDQLGFVALVMMMLMRAFARIFMDQLGGFVHIRILREQYDAIAKPGVVEITCSSSSVQQYRLYTWVLSNRFHLIDQFLQTCSMVFVIGKELRDSRAWLRFRLRFEQNDSLHSFEFLLAVNLPWNPEAIGQMRKLEAGNILHRLCIKDLSLVREAVALPVSDVRDVWRVPKRDSICIDASYANTRRVRGATVVLAAFQNLQIVLEHVPHRLFLLFRI
mmetsp:Transcript_14458/g.20191  ORF Transcript_14458/g.20191 Transcript_14458/m.20191 type:complete len:254 (+) Transcript_14458:2365-3126(+)